MTENTNEIKEVSTQVEAKELVALEKAVKDAPYDWILVRTHTRREKSVKVNIENRLELINLHEYVPEIIVPEETIIQIDNGVKKRVTRLRMPGYILMNLDIYNDEIVAEIRRVNGVIGFAGGSFEPIPMTVSEVLNLLTPIITKAPHEDATKIDGKNAVAGRKSTGQKIEVDFAIGETVTVTSGPFADMEATISQIDVEHERTQVMITIFGRETPVDLHITEIRKH